MISLYFNNCSNPILRGSYKHLAAITPAKGKDSWVIKDDTTGKVVDAYNPPHLAYRTRH